MGLIAMKALAGAWSRMQMPPRTTSRSMTTCFPSGASSAREELEQWLGFFPDSRLAARATQLYREEARRADRRILPRLRLHLPCPAGIQINQCARISLMIRRAPSESWPPPCRPKWRRSACLSAAAVRNRCPCRLDTPNLLKRNLADYRRILAGEVSTESYLRPAQK